MNGAPLGRRGQHSYVGQTIDEHTVFCVAFVRDPLHPGRYVRTHLSVLFVACPLCGAEVGIPCVVVRARVVRSGDIELTDEYPAHLSTTCLQRRAMYREARKSNSAIEKQHRQLTERARVARERLFPT